MPRRPPGCPWRSSVVPGRRRNEVSGAALHVPVALYVVVVVRRDAAADRCVAVPLDVVVVLAAADRCVAVALDVVVVLAAADRCVAVALDVVVVLAAADRRVAMALDVVVFATAACVALVALDIVGFLVLAHEDPLVSFDFLVLRLDAQLLVVHDSS